MPFNVSSMASSLPASEISKHVFRHFAGIALHSSCMDHRNGMLTAEDWQAVFPLAHYKAGRMASDWDLAQNVSSLKLLSQMLSSDFHAYPASRIRVMNLPGFTLYSLTRQSFWFSGEWRSINSSRIRACNCPCIRIRGILF